MTAMQPRYRLQTDYKWNIGWVPDLISRVLSSTATLKVG